MQRFLFCLAAPLFAWVCLRGRGNVRPSPAKQELRPRAGPVSSPWAREAAPLRPVGRAQSSNLLIVNGAHYIIDAGDGVTRRLTRLKTNFRDIGNIFITHPHSDHTSGLGAWMTVMHDAGRADLVNIYGPPGTAASVQGLMQFLSVSSEIRISDGTRVAPSNKVFAGHDTGVGMILQDANVKVTAIENSHFNFPTTSPGKYKSYAYRFDTPDRSVVFTGDTGPSDAIAELAKGADMWCQSRRFCRGMDRAADQHRPLADDDPRTAEAGHSPSYRGAHYARRGRKACSTRPRQDRGANAPSRLSRSKRRIQRFADEVSQNLGGQVLVAKDLMEF